MSDESTCEDCSVKGVRPEDCYTAGRHSLAHKAERRRAHALSRLGA